MASGKILVLFVCAVQCRVRLAAQRAHPVAISLDDDDTDSIVSASFECAICGEPGAPIHIHCCSYAAHRGCIDDGVDVSCPFCQRDVRCGRCSSSPLPVRHSGHWALLRCRAHVAHSQHSTSLAWRQLPALLTIKSVDQCALTSLPHERRAVACGGRSDEARR